VNHPVVEFETIDSTNSEAQRRAAEGERGPLWIRADRQETGRGRSGRSWTSPPGNLSATFMFQPQCSPADLHQLSFVVAIAACEAVDHALKEAQAPVECRLKWPNDLMLGRAKIGGILVETSIFGGELLAIVGCGINIAVCPLIEGREVAALADHGVTTQPAAFLSRLDHALTAWLVRWNGGEGFAGVRAAWLQHAHPVGEPLTINATGGAVSGAFAGLAEDGALLLGQSTGSVRRFHFGDVALGGIAADPGTRDTTEN
jgi:BirA family biotin operon repressor/biotin-[acetyl-CoA-carboxylase] ligase